MYVDSNFFSIFLLFGHAVSYPIFHVNNTQKKVYINCNFADEVRRLKEASIPFSCIPSEQHNTASDEPYILEIAEETSTAIEDKLVKDDSDKIMITLEDKGGRNPIGSQFVFKEVVDVKPSRCTNPNSCVYEVRETQPEDAFEYTNIDSSIECPVGYIYVPSIKECILKMTLEAEVPLEGYVDVNKESLKPRICKEGYYFDIEQMLCLKNKKVFSVNADETIDVSPGKNVRNMHSCKPGSMFVPEVGICLPVEVNPISRPQNIQPVVVAVAVDYPKNKCPAGSVYSPEVGHCLIIEARRKTPSHNRHHSHRHTHETSYALAILNDGPTSAAQVPKIGKHKCEKGMVYVPEIDHCVSHPNDPHNQPQADTSAVQTTTVDPFRPSLSPLTADQIGRRKCPKGTVYVSEIDVCLEPLQQVKI